MNAAQPAPFPRRELQLKGYEGPSPAWSISFEDLRRLVTTVK